jgi:hypothetical protein
MCACAHFIRSTVFPIVLICAVTVRASQTRIQEPENSYTPAQDVQLGREAAAQAQAQMPILSDDMVTSYVADVGRRLVAAVPPELQHAEFQYSFRVVDAGDINAFALPGGPMFVNRGMIQAAKTEGEMAGVMSHELSHVVLRHGTAQAARAQKGQIGQVAGAILGAVIGGRVGGIISQASQFGITTYFLKFSREYEKQSDLLGAQMMARAGYDPRDMANMFRTIQQQGGQSAPEWLSSHPDPGNRSEYVLEEARALRVENPVRDTTQFARVQDRLRGMPPARTSSGSTPSRTGSTRAPGGTPDNIEAPSSRYRTYSETLYRVSVPDNWQALRASDTVTFAPPGGVGSVNGQNVFSHGMEIGVTRVQAQDLRAATDALVSGLTQSNPQLRASGSAVSVRMSGQPGLTVQLTNISQMDQRPESVALTTTLVDPATMLYVIAVAPREDAGVYDQVFRRIVDTITVTR